MRLVPLILAPLAALILFTAPARAEFRVCNDTRHMVAVALARSDGTDWISEGWWNIDAQGCVNVLEGTLRARYYYLYAIQYDIGGGWTGDRYFCTSHKGFKITGRDNCRARGYQRTGFFEVDTQQALDYTHLLTDPSE